MFDRHAPPLADGYFNSHVCKLWFAEDGIERSAKLKGALDGQERKDLWKSLKQILSDMETKGEDEEELSSPTPYNELIFYMQELLVKMKLF
jgi:hypothetical protein